MRPMEVILSLLVTWSVSDNESSLTSPADLQQR